jgi:four helix bundle protein
MPMVKKKEYDIHERIFNFIVAVVTFVQKLPRTTVNQAIIPQIIDSVTSMGANDQEADGAATRKEFVHRYGIVRKEGKETVFWLRLIEATNQDKFIQRANELQVEGREIVSIVSSIISKTSKRISSLRK